MEWSSTRDGYAYPQAVHHQEDDGKASDALKKAKTDTNRHQRRLIGGPTKLKHTYLLEGNNAMEDRVAINRLKPFHVQEGGDELDLQPLPRRGQPARVAEPVALRSPTPAYSPPEEDFPPLTSDTPRISPK